MTRLKRYTSFTALKSNSNSTLKMEQVSQAGKIRLKDFLKLLSSSLLTKDKDKRETKGQ